MYVIRNATFPLWWWLLPPDEAASMSMGLWPVRDLPGALGVGLLSVAWAVIAMMVLPGMARLQAWPGRRLLAPAPGTDLALRVAQLTATRAAALDAHATELRRIERSLHDGTQNRIVAVNVLVGAARRALTRDPAIAEEILERAQDAAEQALAELRGVVRSILPPVLTDRSLADALTGLATSCPVPCRIDADIPVRCAASVEATAYFVVAEALTNITKHSQAGNAAVKVRRTGDRLHVEITDDGRGGADEHNGSGLVGIRRRIEAHDGTFTLTSPAGGPTSLTVSLPCGS
jgi:signal transduction histidine kinase